MLFDGCWKLVKEAEETGTLTVEEALDVATRLPQALFCAMMECLAENGEDPAVIVVQVSRLHETTLRRLREIAKSLQARTCGRPGAVVPLPARSGSASGLH